MSWNNEHGTSAGEIRSRTIMSTESRSSHQTAGFRTSLSGKKYYNGVCQAMHPSDLLVSIVPVEPPSPPVNETMTKTLGHIRALDPIIVDITLNFRLRAGCRRFQSAGTGCATVRGRSWLPNRPVTVPIRACRIFPDIKHYSRL